MIDPTQQPAPAPAPAPLSPLMPGPGPASSPTIPAGMGSPPTPPPMPPPPLPPVQRTVPPAERDPSASGNTFERVAGLLVDHAMDQAKRLSQSLNEAPANSTELSPEQVKEMWYHNPQGSVTQADQTFWQVHDQVLAQTGDHNQAETKALQASYPYRSKLIQMGVAGAEQQVSLAEKLRKTIDGDQAPDSAQVAADHAAHATRIRQSGGKV